MKMIIQKIIAQSGYCSRRNGEKLIREGLVEVNGETAQIGETADPQKDKICVQGHPIKHAASSIYLKLNKPYLLHILQRQNLLYHCHLCLPWQ